MTIVKNPVVITHRSTVNGVSFVRLFKYSNGHEVPMYNVNTVSGFNQILGHAKFLNQQYGDVYYRGITGLYDNVTPSLMRNRSSCAANDLKQTINKIYASEFFKESLKLIKHPKFYSKEEYFLRNGRDRVNKYVIEGLMQHYVGKSRMIDVVDNHWVALWMGLYSLNHYGRNNSYCRYIRREIPEIAYIESSVNVGEVIKQSCSVDDLYLYILLLAMPVLVDEFNHGVYESDEFVKVDLRKALPSIYLRPHAQHALVVGKKTVNNNCPASDFDMSSQVVGVLRVRVDNAIKWVGNGELLTQDNLFPPPAIDLGYDNLLQHNEIFTHPFQVMRYF